MNVYMYVCLCPTAHQCPRLLACYQGDWIQKRKEVTLSKVFIPVLVLLHDIHEPQVHEDLDYKSQKHPEDTIVDKQMTILQRIIKPLENIESLYNIYTEKEMKIQFIDIILVLAGTSVWHAAGSENEVLFDWWLQISIRKIYA